MNLADLSIRRPIFITCLVIIMLALGWMSLTRLPVDLFPDVNFPIVTVSTTYSGASPQEIETLITKPIEDELSTLSGMKRLTSTNYEGLSQVIAEFRLETDVKYAEQQIRDRMGVVKPKLPKDVDEPVIRRVDPSDAAILILAINADLSPAKLFDLADDVVRPRIEQVNQVGVVDITGGRKREIHVLLDRHRLMQRELPVKLVSEKLGLAGENVPSGKVNEGKIETVFRTVGQFQSLNDIRHTMVSLFGNDIPTAIQDVGTVIDTLEDEKTRSFLNGKQSLFLQVYRQSGANTIAVVDAVKKQIDKINAELAAMPGKPKVTLVRDGSLWIRSNVTDVKESIMVGIVLTVLVVLLFLGNVRSTIITGLALPNSLLGAFVLMSFAGFTINIVTLLALSLAVGLLVDDAIVVRENIYRHIELGAPPMQAAKQGTDEVRLAVLATSSVILAVFGPVAFMKGFTGQFFKQFGLTICFAMLISLFDALTMAPMLSAYFAGGSHGERAKTMIGRFFQAPLLAFDRFQTGMENVYEKILRFTVRRPLVILLTSLGIFALSFVAVAFVPKTFFPPPDAGEFQINFDLPPGSNLDTMAETAHKADEMIRAHNDVAITALTVGGRNAEANKANIYIRMVDPKKRSMNTFQLKDALRKEFKAMAYANPIISDYAEGGFEARPFTMNIKGNNEDDLEKVAAQAIEQLKKNPRLKDVDSNWRPGKPEFQVELSAERARLLGISSRKLGDELRAQVEGLTPVKYREAGREYDVRVRLQENQRNLRDSFNEIVVPNLNDKLIRLRDVGRPVEKGGPATINRQDRSRYIGISADLAAGAGLADVLADVDKMFKTDVPLPAGIHYSYVGDTENFQEFGQAVLTALGLSVLFIFLVLASLYESFVTPLAIMLALPLAICGAFFALFVTQESVNLFAMIGMMMLLGVASKNSILLVDLTNQLIGQGMDRASALIIAGKTRLRPILMTTMALIAGTIPVAVGLNEASKQRTSMGVAIIGGLISSTLLSLLVVPASFSYIDRFRLWSQRTLARIFFPKDH